MATMDITYAYTKTRSQFGRQCKLSDKPAELLHSVQLDSQELSQLTANFIARNPVHRATQCSALTSLQEVSH